jgi:hypothetical protein
MLLSHGSGDAPQRVRRPAMRSRMIGIVVFFQWVADNFVARGTSCDAR